MPTNDQNHDRGSGRAKFPEEAAAHSIEDTPQQELSGPKRSSNTETTETTKTTETTRDVETQPSDDSSTGTEGVSDGFIEDGLTRNETIAIVGMTLPAYALAAFVIFQTTATGIGDAPLVLQAVLGFLVVVPLIVLFGISRSTQLIRTLLSIRGNR